MRVESYDQPRYWGGRTSPTLPLFVALVSWRQPSGALHADPRWAPRNSGSNVAGCGLYLTLPFRAIAALYLTETAYRTRPGADPFDGEGSHLGTWAPGAAARSANHRRRRGDDDLVSQLRGGDRARRKWSRVARRSFSSPTRTWCRGSLPSGSHRSKSGSRSLRQISDTYATMTRPCEQELSRCGYPVRTESSLSPQAFGSSAKSAGRRSACSTRSRTMGCGSSHSWRRCAMGSQARQARHPVLARSRLARGARRRGRLIRQGSHHSVRDRLSLPRPTSRNTELGWTSSGRR